MEHDKVLFTPIYTKEERTKPLANGKFKTQCNYKRTIYTSRLPNNLDSMQPDGETYFHRNPKTGNPIHCGITTLRSGIYVFCKEEIFTGLSRSQSWRFACVITEDVALDLILLSGNMELLNKGRLKPLGKKLIKNPDWKPLLTIESAATWRKSEIKIIERRLKYDPNKNQKRAV